MLLNTDADLLFFEPTLFRECAPVSTIIVTGTTTVVCVDPEGRVRRLPDWMLE